MEELARPLAKARHDRDILNKQLFTFDKDVMALHNSKAQLLVLKKRVKNTKQQRKDLEAQFLKVEREKEDMYKKFEVAVEQLKGRAEYKNYVLEEKLNEFQTDQERKEVQLSELVQRSGLDNRTVEEICKKMEEAIEAKNSILRNLKYSLAHATKAYNDAIRVYEAKLQEFGIPAEELGLETLETNTSSMPAGLVAA